MGADSGKEKRAGIWFTDKAGVDKKIEGALRLKFYGREARPAEEPRCIFNPRHLLIPKSTEAHIEAGEEGILVRFCDSETGEEREAIEQARRDEEAAQGQQRGPDKDSPEYKSGFAQAEAALEREREANQVRPEFEVNALKINPV